MNKNRSDAKKKISNKFYNEEFLGLLSSLLPLNEDAQEIKQRAITGEGSVQELVNDYQLRWLHSLDLGDVLKLLKEKGYAEIHEEENYIQYNTQDIARLSDKIKAKIQ